LNRPLFTPRRAREVLSTLRPQLESLCSLYKELEHRCPATIRGDSPVDPGYLRRVLALRVAIGSIERHGVSVSDPKHGRIDFPARRDGRSVRLRWQLEREAFDPPLGPEEESGWDEG